MDCFYHSLPQDPLNSRPRHAVYRINRFRARVVQQAQPRHAKARVPDVHHVAGPVGDAALLGVLAPQDEGDEGVPVDPVRPADDLQAAQHPPAVAHVLGLLGAAVEPAAGDLALAEPAAQAIAVDEASAVAVKPARDGEGRDAGEGLAGMRLGTRADAVSAVEVAASHDVRDGPVDVDQVEEAEQGEGVECAIEESSVLLAPLVAGERARLPVLKAGYELAHLGLALSSRLELVEGVHHGEDLHGTDRVEHVGVMAWSGGETPALVLAREDKINGLSAWEGIRVAEQVEGDEAPVDAVETEMLGQPVVVLILPGVEGLNVFHMVFRGELELIGEL